MIDIHSHIMPGIDDGAADLSASLAMGRLAEQDGVRTIIATPHNQQAPSSVSRDAYLSGVRWLQAQFTAQGVGIELMPGVEVYLDPEVPKLVERGSVFGLNGSRYLLVEFPLNQYPFYAPEVIFKLFLTGVVPVIAHPERNSDIARDPSLLMPLVENGCLVQLTAASLMGVFGREIKRAAIALLEGQYVHIIATDSHSSGQRGPLLSPAVAVASEVVGAEAALAMVTSTPAAVIANRDIEVPRPLPRKAKRSFFRLGR
jgi:protein-tyrosine phosphatase